MKSLVLSLLGLALSTAGGGPDSDGAATAFDPRRHGFDFVNTWSGDMLLDVPLVGWADLGDWSYGLCGGMSFAALDTFYAGGEIPDFASGATPPPPQEFQNGAPLRSFVYGRQMDSLRADDARLLRRLLTWIPRPIHSNWFVTGLADLTKRAFSEKIAPALEKGCPVPLCLVKADLDDMLPDPLNPTLPPQGFTKNHQVVAIGYRRHTAGPDHWDVDIYDPNYPREVHTLHMKLRVQTARVRADGTLYANADDPDENRRGHFRGFFRTPYDPEDPPWTTQAATASSAGARSGRRAALGLVTLAPGEDDGDGASSGYADVASSLDELEERVGALEARAASAPAEAAFPVGASVCLDIAADYSPVHPTRSLPAGVRELSVVLGAGETAPFHEVEAVFVALDVGDAAPRGSEMARSTQPASGENPARFRYRQDAALPAGTYRVDLLGDGAPWRSIPFRIERPRAAGLAPSFPLDLGRTWTYDFVQTAGAGARLVDGETARGNRLEASVEMRVAEAGRGPAHLELRRNGELVSHEWWALDERGLSTTRRIVDGETYDFEPPQPLLAPDAGVSAWEYVNPELGVAQRCRQWGPLALSGPWGSASGFLVRIEQPDGALLTTVEREFVPSIGMVRERITTARDGRALGTQELVLRASPGGR